MSVLSAGGEATVNAHGAYAHSKGGVYAHPIQGCTVGAVIGYHSINPRLVYAYTASSQSGGCTQYGARLFADLFGGIQVTGLTCTAFGLGGVYVTPLLYGNPVRGDHYFSNPPGCTALAQVVWAPWAWHP